MSNDLSVDGAKIAWNISYENFKVHGPDYPAFVDFRRFFGDGAFIAWLPHRQLPNIIDPLMVALEPANIEINLDKRKWKKLKQHIEGGGSVSPAWAKIFGGRLWIYQGVHRFSMAIVSDAKTIPVIVNRFDAEHLKTACGCQVERMPD